MPEILFLYFIKLKPAGFIHHLYDNIKSKETIFRLWNVCVKYTKETNRSRLCMNKSLFTCFRAQSCSSSYFEIKSINEVITYECDNKYKCAKILPAIKYHKISESWIKTCTHLKHRTKLKVFSVIYEIIILSADCRHKFNP